MTDNVIVNKLKNYKVLKVKKRNYELLDKVDDAKSIEKDLEIIDNALNLLEDTEKKIIIYRYIDNASWKVISQKINLSESRCYQIRKIACSKLKEIL
ncbi:MAG: sigma-70 family RNA polymerase sigma factor [Clostridium sp.]|uniref:sigma-70 family RNA polymerase sigma factor n=1 Tax=Clostridium TaxID=1485 RepID=UPI001883C93B|nr:sigma-70 family RNA polymerase sigma factor [Clostridium chrysemydis]